MLNFGAAVMEECEANFCENGGTCTKQVLTYLCQCTPEYEGSLCQDKGIIIIAVLEQLRLMAVLKMVHVAINVYHIVQTCTLHSTLAS